MTPERLPPPPFWRTRYFAMDVLARRRYLDPAEIIQVLGRPTRKTRQEDGRIHHWGGGRVLTPTSE